MRDVKRRSALIVDWSNFVRTGGRRLGGAKEEEEGEGADQDNLITDYARAVKLREISHYSEKASFTIN